MPVRFVVVGGGPAGVEAAATTARLGAEVTLIERDLLGGAANLWDCIPSKAMIAIGGMRSQARRSEAFGLAFVDSRPDLEVVRKRLSAISEQLSTAISEQLTSQGVRIVHGTACLVGPHEVEIVQVSPTAGQEREEIAEVDAILLSTGSTPRIPDWAELDGERILVTRQAYPPPAIPDELVVIGSGVTGVEFVHMFRSLGSHVTLIVSRQQVLPTKDPEIAAAPETDFLDSGVTLVKGARATRAAVTHDGVVVECSDGRSVNGSHVLLAIGSVPSSEGLGLERARVETDDHGYVPVNHHCQTNLPHIFAAGDLAGRLQLASVATMQGRKVAEHVMGLHTREHRHLDYDKAAQAIFTEPEIAEVGIAEADAFALGRKIRVTKVPFAANAKATVEGDARGFVKLVSDPATGVVLGGAIVGAHAAELISVIALAVSARLRVSDIAESLFVHPARAEALGAAAE